MSRIEQVEYYSVCPSCGGVGTGDRCEYCGASLVKSRSIIETGDADERFLAEDVGLPVIRGRICERSGVMILFCLLFGGIFAGVSVLLFTVFLSVRLFVQWFIPFFGLFFLIGLAAIFPLVVRGINRRKCLAAKPVRGIVRGYEETSVTLNSRPILCMRVRLPYKGRPALLMLYTGDTIRRYPVGGEVRLKNYRHYYLFDNDR